MLRVNYTELKDGYEILCRHSEYWEFDNDYNREFAILSDAVKNWEKVSYESKPYVMDVLYYMLRASQRIFKTEVPILE